MAMMSKSDPRYVDYLVELAAQAVGKGVIEEPRLYYDQVTLRSAAPLITPFTGDVFRNGEDFDVRITHLIAAMRPDFSDPQPGAFDQDERMVQLVSLRLRFHDTYYQNEILLPVPLWANKPVTAPDSSNRGVAQWILDRPFILSARDAMRCRFSPEEQPTGDFNIRRFGTAMTGVGLLSKRPYMLSSYKEVEEAGDDTFNPLDFKNDGTEPIAITDVSFYASGDLSGSSPVGDIRTCMFEVQGLGNGTQRPWMIGPAVQPTPALPMCPGQLLGISTGRSIVHRFPGEGVLWHPGEGVTAEAISTATASLGFEFVLGFAGYIVVD